MNTRIGHNSSPDSGQLRALVERIERLHEERAAIVEDIAGTYQEAKSAGFDKKALAYVIKLRAQDQDKRAAFETIVDIYENAIGGP